MQNVVNTQITNVVPGNSRLRCLQWRIDWEMEMLPKEVLQSFALSAKAEKTAKGISERKGKEVQRAISAKG
jgi:hypothetical protein